MEFGSLYVPDEASGRQEGFRCRKAGLSNWGAERHRPSGNPKKSQCSLTDMPCLASEQDHASPTALGMSPPEENRP